PVLVPFVLALFFTYWLTPIIDVQVRRLGIHRWLAVVNTAILALALLGGIGVMVAASIGKAAPAAADASGAPTTKPYEAAMRSVGTWISQTRPGRWLGIKPESPTL